MAARVAASAAAVDDAMALIFLIATRCFGVGVGAETIGFGRRVDKGFVPNLMGSRVNLCTAEEEEEEAVMEIDSVVGAEAEAEAEAAALSGLSAVVRPAVAFD